MLGTRHGTSTLQCGTHHTLAISEIGTLWACGQNGKVRQRAAGVSSVWRLQRPKHGHLPAPATLYMLPGRMLMPACSTPTPVTTS